MACCAALERPDRAAPVQGPPPKIEDTQRDAVCRAAKEPLQSVCRVERRECNDRLRANREAQGAILDRGGQIELGELSATVRLGAGRRVPPPSVIVHGAQ